MKLLGILLFLGLSIHFISCTPQQKLPNYLEKLSDSTMRAEVQMPELRIQKSDLLSIQVYSASTKPEISDAIFNLPAQATGDGTGASPGFLVDINGNIEYPRIGLIRAEGLTKLQLADTIKRKINEKDSVLMNPSVIIRFQNVKVTLLGEVNKEGPISVPVERVTILEAIGLAGGIKDYGMKDSVLVIREIDGKRMVGSVDLTSNNLFESPYYHLMQNDVVVVEPSKRKARKTEQEVFYRQAGFVVSLITAIAVVITVFQ